MGIFNQNNYSVWMHFCSENVTKAIMKEHYQKDPNFVCVHRHQVRLLTIPVIWLLSQIWLPQHILLTAYVKEQLDRFLTSGMS